MKKLNTPGKIGILLLALVFTTEKGICGTFTSTGGGTTWTGGATSWTIVGDADGIPDADDDIIIQSGHTITFSASSLARNITVNSGGTLNSTGGATKVLGVYGDFIINGTENCSSTIEFRNGTGTTVGGTGSHGTNSQWVFSSSRTIASTVTATKNYYVRVYGATTVITNNANLTLYSLNCQTSGARWNQGANSTLKIKTNMLMDVPVAGGVFDASTNPNLVILDFTPLKGVPKVLSNTYYNLQLPSNRYTITVNPLIILNDFIIGNNAIFTMNHNISIGHNFTVIVNGVFTQAAGTTVTMNGTTAQSMACSTNMTFQGLTIDNSGSGVTITVARPYLILEHLTLANGNFNISTATSVTLVSDASKTAVIGNSPNGSLTGGNKFIAQRFISARNAGYSDMASSISNQTFASWEDDLILTYTYSPPDFYPTAYGYDETSFDYVPITASSTTLDPGVGYMVYLDSDGNQTTFNNTTIDLTGTPNLGDVDMSGYVTAVNDGWNLLGNPYHANISWDALHATTNDISSDIMFFDENVDNGDGTFGDFVTVSTGSGELIAPNQGVWVNVTGGSPSFIFSEATKSSSTSSVFRSSNLEQFFSVRLKNVDDRRFSSGTNFRFSADPENALKKSLPNLRLPHPEAPSLCSVSPEGKDLKINLLNAAENTLSIPLKIEAGLSGTHTIEAQNLAVAINEGYTCVTLFDKTLGQFADLSNGKYEFYAEKGIDKDRFVLILSKGGNCLKSADANVVSSQIDIYQAGNEAVVKFEFDVETELTISITDLLGKSLVPTQIISGTSQEVRFNLPNNYSGVYLVNAYHNNGVASRKLFR